MYKRLTVVLVAGLALVACGGDGDSGEAADQEFSTGPQAPFAQHVEPGAQLASCVLLGGTMGVPDPIAWDFLPDLGSHFYAAVLDAPPDLPQTVHLRTDTESFNRRYMFALREGRVWYRAVADEQGQWIQAPMPACLVDTLIGIAADDDELIAIRRDGAIYGMDNILKDPLLFNWTSRWGPPVWTGDGHRIPADYRAWTWTVISNAEDENWTDPAGNQTRVGDGKVSHIWLLRDDGQRYTLIDPWLPRDESYEMCGPLRGRFKAVNLSASGSTIMVINHYGEIYTRHFDFDLAGFDDVFFDYSYEDQRGVQNAPIQLPVFDWLRQPKVPGEITHQISLHKLGKNMIYRTMRIEGRDAEGQTGYWEKDISEPGSSAWVFVRTDEPLRGTLLDNSMADTSERDTGPSEDEPLGRNMDHLGSLDAAAPLSGDDDWAAEIVNFNFYCSPAMFRVYTSADESMDLILHTRDAIRQTERGRGLDENPRTFYGNIEVPEAMLAGYAQLGPRQQAFLDLYLNRQRFTDVNLSGVTGQISLWPRGTSGSGFVWVFRTPGSG